MAYCRAPRNSRLMDGLPTRRAPSPLRKVTCARDRARRALGHGRVSDARTAKMGDAGERMAFEEDNGYICCGINGCILVINHTGACVFPELASRGRRGTNFLEATTSAPQLSKRPCTSTTNLHDKSRKATSSGGSGSSDCGAPAAKKAKHSRGNPLPVLSGNGKQASSYSVSSVPMIIKVMWTPRAVPARGRPRRKRRGPRRRRRRRRPLPRLLRRRRRRRRRRPTMRAGHRLCRRTESRRTTT